MANHKRDEEEERKAEHYLLGLGERGAAEYYFRERKGELDQLEAMLRPQIYSQTEEMFAQKHGAPWAEIKACEEECRGRHRAIVYEVTLRKRALPHKRYHPSNFLKP